MARAAAAKVRERKDRESMGDMVGVRNEPATLRGCDYEEPQFGFICICHRFGQAQLEQAVLFCRCSLDLPSAIQMAWPFNEPLEMQSGNAIRPHSILQLRNKTP